MHCSFLTAYQAGLFSAVLTAFNIESYKLLQEDPAETSAALLAQISAQLGSGTASSVSPSYLGSSSSFRPDTRSVRINILWFSSLVLSLVSASIGILTKQWLREYMSNTASSHRENARIRQLRHEGFVRWNVPLTIALLPILLQIAMALFFAGLLDLLWSLHPAVAGVVTGLVTISLSFLILTTLLPTVFGDCPYKSPQAMGVFLLAQGFIRLLSYLAGRLYSFLRWDRRQWPIYVEPTLFKRRSRLLAGWLRSLMHRKYFESWREREKAIVRQGEAKLDHRILAGADAIFMDDDFLEHVVRACINDTDCPAAVDCVHEIIIHRADGMMDGVPHWRHGDDVDGTVALLLHMVADVLPRIEKGEVVSIEKTLLIADRLCRAIPFEDLKKSGQTIYLHQRVFEGLSAFLVHQESVKRASFELMRSLWAKMVAPVPPSGTFSPLLHIPIRETNCIYPSDTKPHEVRARSEGSPRSRYLSPRMRDGARLLDALQPSPRRLQHRPRRASGDPRRPRGLPHRPRPRRRRARPGPVRLDPARARGARGARPRPDQHEHPAHPRPRPARPPACGGSVSVRDGQHGELLAAPARVGARAEKAEGLPAAVAATTTTAAEGSTCAGAGGLAGAELEVAKYPGERCAATRGRVAAATPATTAICVCFACCGILVPRLCGAFFSGLS